jgi:hypothetical protein
MIRLRSLRVGEGSSSDNITTSFATAKNKVDSAVSGAYEGRWGRIACMQVVKATFSEEIKKM